LPVLLVAIGSQHEAIRLGAIRALVDRRNHAGHREILERFPHYNDRAQAVVTETLRRSTHRMKPALEEAITAENLDLCESACHLITQGRVYELMPTLVTVAENRVHRHSARAAATLVQLAQLLHQEVTGEASERTCDPMFVRRQMLPAIEKAIVNYDKHRRLEIVDAFLLVVPPANKTLLDVLTNSGRTCHQTIVQSFGTSAVTSVLQLLVEMLHDTTTPRAVLEIVAQRRDRKFLDYMLHHVGAPASLRVQENMRRLFAVPWLEDAREVLLELDGPAQAVAAELAVASSINRNRQFELLRFLLRRGRPEARRACCEAMNRFHDRESDECIAVALKDSDPRVQAVAIKQIRRRHIPNAMERLVGYLDHPAAEVREAARESLAEFNFARYETSFDHLDPEMRTLTGRIVCRVDASTTERLVNLLGSAAPSARIRAIEMAKAMNYADNVLESLIALARDIDPAVRAEAVSALATCSREEALEALERSEQDPNYSIREAAAAGVDAIILRLSATSDRHSGQGLL
jgi:hypothetical protein